MVKVVNNIKEAKALYKEVKAEEAKKKAEALKECYKKVARENLPFIYEHITENITQEFVELTIFFKDDSEEMVQGCVDFLLKELNCKGFTLLKSELSFQEECRFSTENGYLTFLPDTVKAQLDIKISGWAED